MGSQGNSGDSGMVNTFVFIAGFLLGAGAALLLAPEAGANVRERLSRGVRTAQDEFSGVAADTKDAFNTLSQDAQHAMKNTATRFNAAMEATKDAIKSPTNDQVVE
ncbi:MAG: YtxH domain-containing protein [Nitrospirota bacterium]|nr:MAG: YtxH domain-containing protein [Nitrospirota bacterium]